MPGSFEYIKGRGEYSAYALKFLGGKKVDSVISTMKNLAEKNKNIVPFLNIEKDENTKSQKLILKADFKENLRRSLENAKKSQKSERRMDDGLLNFGNLLHLQQPEGEAEVNIDDKADEKGSD